MAVATGNECVVICCSCGYRRLGHCKHELQGHVSPTAVLFASIMLSVNVP